MVKEILRQIGLLERFPQRCAVIPEAGELDAEYRHIIYGNYRTIYRIAGHKVIIMRVVHGAMLIDKTDI